MKTQEKMWNGKPLSELLTPWKAGANRILKQMGWFWYGVFDCYKEYFSDPDLFVLFFQTTAADYGIEYGDSYGAFQKRLETALDAYQRMHGALPEFYNPLTTALWRVSLGMTEKNLTNFLLEPEVKLISRMGHEFLRRVYLGYKPPFGEWPGIPPLEFFDGLPFKPDIEIHEVVKLRKENQKSEAI